MPAPDAPVLGVDGCRGGWLAARVRGDDRMARLVGWALGRFAEVLDGGAEPDEVVAVDIPVGLPATGRRACDVAGRAALGGTAASRLFFAPPRYALDAPDLATANDLLRARGEPGMSAQTYALRAAVLEVATADLPVCEVHPDLSFTAMTGHVLASKHTATGVQERMDALAGWTDVRSAVSSAPARVGVDDVLDALVAAWTATRIRSGRAITYPAGAAHGAPRIRA
ncbi:MAG: DUF429 domain-containing protein [Actinomycetes bacterium]